MPQTTWDQAFEAIKEEARTNKEGVMQLAEELMPLLLSLYPNNMTLMAALYSMAVSGARMIQKEEVHEA